MENTGDLYDNSAFILFLIITVSENAFIILSREKREALDQKATLDLLGFLVLRC